MPLSYATLAAVKARMGITVTTYDALLTTFVNSVNTFLESGEGIGCAIGPSTGVRLFDGYRSSRDIFVRDGVRAINTFEYAYETGGAWIAADLDDIILRPLEQDREPGWPAQYISFTDIALTGWYKGHANYRSDGDWGPSATPADITDAAETTVVRAWLSRRTGETDITGLDEVGQPIVSRFISGHHWRVIKHYRNITRNWYRRAG